MPAPSTTTSPSRRGRPARFSREQIVAAVAEMLLADPAAPLTIARAAEAVGAKPMSLYRHFADRDDLVAAVAAHVFGANRPAFDGDEPWQDQIRGWMTAVYRQATAVPQLVQLAASGESAVWLADSAYLAQVLEQTGVGDDALLARAIYWVATTTMGQAMIAAAGQDHLPVEPIRASLHRLGQEDAARIRRLLPHLDGLREDGFDAVVEWTITGLEQLLGVASHP